MLIVINVFRDDLPGAITAVADFPFGLKRIETEFLADEILARNRIVAAEAMNEKPIGRAVIRPH